MTHIGDLSFELVSIVDLDVQTRLNLGANPFVHFESCGRACTFAESDNLTLKTTPDIHIAAYGAAIFDIVGTVSVSIATGTTITIAAYIDQLCTSVGLTPSTLVSALSAQGYWWPAPPLRS